MKKTTKATDTKTKAAAAAVTLDAKGQREAFAAAIKTFTAGKFQAAQALFEEAAQGPDLGVVESGRMYARMCEQRLNKPQVELRTAEEHYNFAVSQLNQARWDVAARHLEKALEGEPRAAHLHYAQAVARGRLGQTEEARRHLELALELDPHTRMLARTDPDFQPLLDQAALRAMIYPERAA
jgi:tetratricopeptide (TPR) repeat protein